MRHVLVETNWVWGYAAPGHHKDLDAVSLLRRSRQRELRLHLPGACLTEARQSILTKCQPRREANAVRGFLARAKLEQIVTEDQERLTLEVLDKFEQQVHKNSDKSTTSSTRFFTRQALIFFR